MVRTTGAAEPAEPPSLSDDVDSFWLCTTVLAMVGGERRAHVAPAPLPVAVASHMALPCLRGCNQPEATAAIAAIVGPML